MVFIGESRIFLKYKSTLYTCHHCRISIFHLEWLHFQWNRERFRALLNNAQQQQQEQNDAIKTNLLRLKTKEL